MKRIGMVTAGALSLVLVACGTSEQDNMASNRAAEGAREAAEANAPLAPADPASRLLAAAEPFEQLTETAFTDPPATLDRTIASGRDAITAIRSILAPAAARRIDGLLDEIADHRKTERRADLALSSIELYRELVTAVPSATKVPADVSLLDYAGFRYQADLKAAPVRWDDMAKAAAFGRERWTAIKPKVRDQAVAAPFEAALRNMERAAAGRDPALAASAATAELDLVDKLEEYFAAR